MSHGDGDPSAMPVRMRTALDLDDDLSPVEKRRIRLERVFMGDRSYEAESAQLSLSGGTADEIQPDLVVDRVVATFSSPDETRRWVVTSSDGHLRLTTPAACPHATHDPACRDVDEDTRSLEQLLLQKRGGNFCIAQVSPGAWSHRVVRITYILDDRIQDLYVWESLLLQSRKDNMNAASLLRQIRERVKSTVHGDETSPPAGPPRRLQDLPDECLEQILEGKWWSQC